MPPKPKSKKRSGAVEILVAGDVCLDVVGVPIPEKPTEFSAENWRLTGEIRTHFLPGGAMLLAEFIRAPRLAQAQEQAGKEAEKQIKSERLKDTAAGERRHHLLQAARHTVEDEIAGPRPKRPVGITDGASGELYVDEFLAIAERLRRDEIVHSLLALAQFPSTAKENDKRKTLRVDEAHGYSGPPQGDPKLVIAYPETRTPPKIIVLDDTGNRFRKHEPSNPWPPQLQEHAPKNDAPLIVYKLHRPLPCGPEGRNTLWTETVTHHPFNRIVVTSVDDLRELGIPVSLGLSWERTALDVVWNLLNVPALVELKNCPRLIVRLGESGAVYWQHRNPPAEKNDRKMPETHRAWLIYDPCEIEGSFTARFNHRGNMVALGSAFTAALVQHLATTAATDFSALLAMPPLPNGQDKPPMEAPVLSGIRAGLLASRRLLQRGFGNSLEEPRYPEAELFEPAEEDDASFACRPVPIIPGALQPDRAYWRLLEDIFTDAPSELRTAVELTATASKPEKSLRVDASPNDVAAADPKTRAAHLLNQAPIAVFAKALRTYDRREIENYRALYSLMRDYIRLREPERPLSVAVFGPPGAGKSFGVKQVAKALTEQNQQRPIVDLTFNLSQYQTAEELAAAFHLVRDLVLQGRIPLVFFDEFDAALAGHKLAWLRYFLAPMQDGQFLDRGVLHPIGQAIFVFAGGTCDTYQDFAVHAPGSESEKDFKTAKGPDFLSRLRGALDVPSLNYVLPQGPHAPSRPGTFDPYGPIENYPCEAAILLRRAGVIAYQLGIKGPTLKDAKDALRISPEVLRTFLYLPKFEHGNRSLEALLDMSHLYGNRNYTSSLLPPPVHAAMHANPVHLEQLVGTGYPFPQSERETIARAIHTTYLASKPTNVDPLALLEWDEPRFPDHLKQSNLEQADHIATKLQFVGLWFRKTPPGTPAPDLVRMEQIIQEHLEFLAQFEHDRWAAQRRRQGWSAGRDNSPASKVPALKLHNCLIPWNKLTPDQQKLDHDTIRAIPRHLAAAGYEIVKP